MRTRRSLPLFIRFVRLVDVRSPKECWPWLGAVAKNSGYGHISIGNGVTVSAHRVAYHLTYMVDIGESLVTHTCDTKLCVNPYHLRLGTPQTNMQEFMDRGTTDAWWGARSKIGPAEAEQMRQEYAFGGISMAGLGRAHGVTASCVHAIVHRHRRLDRVSDGV